MAKRKNEVALASMGQLMAKHGDTLQQMGITAVSFNTMAVVKKTNQLKKEKAFLDKEVADLEAQRTTIDKKTIKAINDLSKAAKAPAEKEFLAFCKAIKAKKPVVEVQVDLHCDEKKGRCLRTTAQYRRNEKEGYHTRYSTAELRTLPKSIKALDVEIAKVNEALTSVRQEVMEVRVQLQDIGEMERNANAHTTHNLLSQTEDGAVLLASMGLTDLE